MSTWKPRLIAIMLVVGSLATIGLGMGLTGYVTADTLTNSLGGEDTGSGSTAAAVQQSFMQLFVLMFVFEIAIFTFFLGPMAGGLAGLVSGLIVTDWKDGALIGGVGSFVGFYPMVVLAVAIMFMGLDMGSVSGGTGGTGGGSPIDLGQLLRPALTAGIPTGIVGAITGALGNKF